MSAHAPQLELQGPNLVTKDPGHEGSILVTSKVFMARTGRLCRGQACDCKERLCREYFAVYGGVTPRMVEWVSWASLAASDSGSESAGPRRLWEPSQPPPAALQSSGPSPARGEANGLRLLRVGGSLLVRRPCCRFESNSVPAVGPTDDRIPNRGGKPSYRV